MDSEIWKKRFVKSLFPKEDKRGIFLLTGARQTGKTSLMRRAYSSLNYINFDLAENREKLLNLPIQNWPQTIGRAVIDEVQKEPRVFENIKYVYDEKRLDFLFLLGSSQILLLKQIRESLAGRIAIYELFPLMLSELLSMGEEQLVTPLIDHLLQGEKVETILEGVPAALFGDDENRRLAAEAHLQRWGGMPALVHLQENERTKWIKDYEYTYLERDLADLARLNDLMPFRTLQKIAALRSGQLLSYSELARDAAIGVDRARRYLEYLQLSYQVFSLPPYYANATKRLVKTPKLYWLDIGIWRQLTGYWGELSGEGYETYVISELIKWVRTMQRGADLYFYRTHSGAEIDLIIETPNGIIGAEIKSRERLAAKDSRHLKLFAKAHEDRWLGGLIIYPGKLIEKIADPDIWAIPTWRLFS